MTDQATTTSNQVPQNGWQRIKFSPKIVIVFGCISIFFLGFIFGQYTERARARHMIFWRDNYRDNLIRPFGGPIMRPPIDRPMGPRAHAALGKILTMDDNKLTISGEDGFEQVIVINDKTIFRNEDQSASKDGLRVDARIAVFGSPNEKGQIDAKLIRIFETQVNP